MQAAYSKRRRRDEQPIRADLAEQLRPWLASLPPHELIWPKLPHSMASIVAADCKAAEIEVVDAEGGSLTCTACGTPTARG